VHLRLVGLAVDQWLSRTLQLLPRGDGVARRCQHFEVLGRILQGIW
jgi:hypothetical protein